VSLPPDLSTVTVTGTFMDATGGSLKGSVTFTPSSVLTDATGKTILDGTYTCRLEGGSFTSAPLVTTDSEGLSPAGWRYVITIALEDTAPLAYTRAIPQHFGPVDISALIAQAG
jgi:hypothetical protein